MNPPKWKLLHSDVIVSTPWLSVEKNMYRTDTNRTVEDYYVVSRADFVLVVAVRRGKLVLVRQYRPATDNFYWALPAGFLDPGEVPVVAAERELLEEAGYAAKGFAVIGELHPLPGYIRSAAHVVFCEVYGEPSSSLDHAEIAEVGEFAWADVMAKILRGEIKEMQAVAAILLAKELLQDSIP